MEEKRYQVFVSSTYEDLQEERKEVMQALLELDCIPAGMELFPASNEDQWSLIKRVIDDCDYYLLIVGGRYGSVNEEKGVSYTQMEFEYALDKGKPIISFIHKHPENISSGKSEKTEEGKEKLEEFKNLVKKKMIRYWETPSELGSVVSRSMIRLIKDFPATGWVKAENITNEASLLEIAKLQKENSELRAQIQSFTTKAPKGTEELSQGNDLVEIDITFSGSEVRGFKTYRFYEKMSFAWDDLFCYIAPSLIDECTDSKMKHLLDNAIEARESELITCEHLTKYTNFTSFEVDSDSFGLIKVQFRALGLICLSEKKRAASNHNTYWKLTPFGDYYMTKLLAIRKNKD